MLDVFYNVIGLLNCYFGWISLLFFFVGFIYWFGILSYIVISYVVFFGFKFWFYFGNFLDVFKYGGLYKVFLEYGKRYGKVYKMFMGRDVIIVVVDLEMLKYIFVKDFYKFRNRLEFIVGRVFLSKGLFGVRDDDWK